MQKIHNTIIIKAAPDKVWSVVGDLAGIGKWAAGIGNATVNGNTRVCTVEAGGELKEEISNYSEEKRSYTYKILDGPVPVKNYIGTLAVIPDGEGASVVWDASFDVLDPAHEKEVLGMLDGIYRQSLESLRSLIE